MLAPRPSTIDCAPSPAVYTAAHAARTSAEPMLVYRAQSPSNGPIDMPPPPPVGAV